MPTLVEDAVRLRASLKTENALRGFEHRGNILHHHVAAPSLKSFEFRRYLLAEVGDDVALDLTANSQLLLYTEAQNGRRPLPSEIKFLDHQA